MLVSTHLNIYLHTYIIYYIYIYTLYNYTYELQFKCKKMKKQFVDNHQMCSTGCSAEARNEESGASPQIREVEGAGINQTFQLEVSCWFGVGGFLVLGPG